MPLDRRAFVGLLAGTPALRAQGPEVEVRINLREETATINPLIYGHFAEHIGRVIYEATWIGADSPIPNQDGLRLDTLEALKRVRPAVIRWPGGCFADTYHWEDGVGPPEDRPTRRNHWWQRDEPNTFGTAEFVRWCKLLGAEPYPSVNVGSGSVSEALNWLHYCNGSEDTGYAGLRRSHGQAEPYGVKWWGIGNENWGCGGLFSPQELAQRFRQYAVYFKRLGLTQGLQLVAAGHNAPGWNLKFLQAVGPGLPYLDHISFHRYFRRGHSTEFTDAEYLELMLDVTDFEKLIQESLQAIDQVEPLRAKMRVFGPLKPNSIGLVIDEWGAWHSDPVIEDGFSQRGVMREALFAASCLNLFHRYAGRIVMTNIAQVANCLHSLILTKESRMAVTPTFHVYEMYRPHQGARALRTEIAKSSAIGLGDRTQATVSVSASKSGREVLLTLVNQHSTETVDAAVAFTGGDIENATARSLAGPSVRAENTVEQPSVVVPQRVAVGLEPHGLRLLLRPGSVQAVTLRLGSA